MARAQADLGTSDPLGIVAEASENDKTSGMVVGYIVAEPAAPEPPTTGVPAYSLVRLSHEAALEHARLMRQRVLSTAGRSGSSTTAASDLLVARARRGGLRTWLGSNTFVLMETACEDGAGRVVATCVTPLLVRTRAGFAPIASNHKAAAHALRIVLRALETTVVDELDPAVTKWVSDTVRFHGAFWSRRLANERAIGRVPTHGASLFQPGLFDRRAVAERHAMNRAAHALQQDTTRRIRAAEAAGDLIVRPARPVLILMPRQWP
jgi:hypothetical protein